MRFSYLITAFLASLTIASPIASPEAVENTNLAIRAADVNKPEWTLATTAHPDLKKDDWVWFTLEWHRGSIGDGDTESDKEISDLRDKLGFDHIGIVVGQIKETTSGKGKNLKTTRSFDAVLYHMIEIKEKSELKNPNFKAPDPSEAKTLVFGGLTTSNKATAAKKAAKDYFDGTVHDKYAVNGNNCNDFVNAVKAKVV